MTRIYFDVTDIVYFASRYSRVTGIQRVQLNIINLLASRHGGEIIRCSFFDRSKNSMFEFDPTCLTHAAEFDAESFLADIGMAKSSSVFPGKVQVKSYLRRYNNNKMLRTLRKIEIYLSALFMPQRLWRFGLTVKKNALPSAATAPASALTDLSPSSRYVCMGSIWLHPQIWEFAQAHRNRGGEVVQMVYDLIPVLYPQYLPANEPPAFVAWLNSALRYATRFISISNWTAGDLRKFAHKEGYAPVIQTIPLAPEFTGYERLARIDTPLLLSDLAGIRFVLCVGTIEHRKNGVVLLQVWQQLIDELGERMPLLVFAGKLGKGGAEFQDCLERSRDLSKYVRIVHAPSDHDLAWLYGNALFSVLPSLIEGWGLPVGESAWFGKLCVASNATSIPEVCGELMDYVDPRDPQSIKAGLRKVILDEAYLRRRESAIATAKLRTWNEVADDIFEFAVSSPQPQVIPAVHIL